MIGAFGVVGAVGTLVMEQDFQLNQLVQSSVEMVGVV